jgi:hypothetical protein
LNEEFLAVQIGDVGMENANQFPFLLSVNEINLHKEPKRLFYKNEIPGISKGHTRALQ